jgi:hypothetical protein
MLIQLDSFRALALASFLLLAGQGVAADEKLERPPQFVAIAFDNCTEIDTWKSLAAFLEAANTPEHRTNFTFFVSAINFLADENAKKYRSPVGTWGSSNIGFGGSPDALNERVTHINRFHAAGHEIASHAVGHFYGGDDKCGPRDDGKPPRPGFNCGGNWTASQWSEEFASFNALLDNVAPNNNLKAKGFDFKSGEVVGFRAPQLSTNAAMYEALKHGGFRYDTSSPDGADPDSWPKRNSAGTWLFGLARVRIVGLMKGGKPVSTLSMDYNFCFKHAESVGASCDHNVGDVRKIEMFGKQMVDSYVEYFRRNYLGNRAPVHIGHHFFPYQAEIYNKALLNFARVICRLPEVRCVTYKELASFMDSVKPETLASYQRGQFSSIGLVEPTILVPLPKTKAPIISLRVTDGKQLAAKMALPEGSSITAAQIEWRSGGNVISRGPILSASKLRGLGEIPLFAQVIDSAGGSHSTGEVYVRALGRGVEIVARSPELSERALRDR